MEKMESSRTHKDSNIFVTTVKYQKETIRIDN